MLTSGENNLEIADRDAPFRLRLEENTGGCASFVGREVRGFQRINAFAKTLQSRE
jgi:hypothetical protein